MVGGGNFADTLALPISGSFAGSAGGTGTAGMVTVNAQANIVTTGLDSIAVFAQSSDRTGTGSAIGITLGNGTTGTAQMISGGSGAGNGVRMMGGAANTLTTFATLTTTSAIDGTTIVGGLGGDNVVNYGHLIGSVDLGGGANSLDNKPYRAAANPTPTSGVFESGVTLDLGAGNTFTNEGLFSPGSFLRELTTVETGNFVQTSTGSCGTFGAPTTMCGYYGVDINFDNQATDHLTATGTANVAGAVVVNINNPGEALPGAHDSVIVHAAGGVTNSGLILQAQPTAVATYSLLFPNPTDVDLHYAIDFSPAGLTQNQHHVGTAINQIQLLRAYPSFIPIAAALFYQPTVQQLRRTYDSLSGEGVAATQQTSFNANDLFQTSIMREIGFWFMDNERSDASANTLYEASILPHGPAENVDVAKGGVPSLPLAARRTWRAWAVGNGGGSNYAGDPVTVGSAPVSIRGAGFASGLDYQVGRDALVGVAAGYGAFSFGVPDRQTFGSVQGAHVAAYGALREGDGYVRGLLAFDSFYNSEHRTAAIPGTTLPSLFDTPVAAVPGFYETPKAQFGSRSVSGMFEAGHRYRFDAFDVTPFAGLQFASLRQDGTTETNSNSPSTIGLNLLGRTIASVPSFVGAQLNASTQIGPGLLLDSWLRAAWKHEFASRRSIDATFIAAPGFDFVIDGAKPPRDAARLNVGARLIIGANVSVFAAFDSDLAAGSRNLAGSGGIRVQW